MSEKMIHLEFTPMQANHLAIMVKLAKEMLAVAPGVAVYPNLGDFKMERELVKTAIDSTQKVLIKQLEEQMPTK
jgi:hypothetical protein